MFSGGGCFRGFVVMVLLEVPRITSIVAVMAVLVGYTDRPMEGMIGWSGGASAFREAVQ